MTTVKSQKKTFRTDYIDAQGNPCTLIAEVRHDDECRNGHNSFAITGDLYEIHQQRGEPTIKHASGKTLWLGACGCLHDEIAAHIPELAPFIKWHLCSTDGPMHYIANTLYHAGDLDYNGLKTGEPNPRHVEHRLRCLNSPFTKPVPGELYAWLQDNPCAEYVAVAHVNRPGTNYDFGPKYAPLGFTDDWYACPWDTEREAQEFVAAYSLPHEITTVPTSFGKGKTRDLDAARRSAVWPEATDAELSLPKDELRAKLEARLPALLVEFRAAVESLGLTF
jgi:hypothetical protein